MRPPNMEEALLQAMREAPADVAPRLVLADWLEEQGAADRAELLRLDVELRRTPPTQPSPQRLAWERRLQDLLAAGARPVVPERGNSIEMRFVLIPPGRFLMGTDSVRDEAPRHEVEITRAFDLGVFPVTQREYRTVLGTSPSYLENEPDHPVEQVSWLDAVAFCERLSGLPAEQAAGRSYRLPTEAEWEHACRAGTTTDYHFGDAVTSLLANYETNGTTKVGSYRPNAWGLYDMHGNVWEWCADAWDANYYAISPVQDPRNTAEERTRSIRGGAWFGDCRAAVRQGWADDFRYRDLGFRVVCVTSEKAGEQQG